MKKDIFTVGVDGVSNRLAQRGILPNAQYLPSPHYNDRPNPAEISLLVIHCISLPPGQYQTNNVVDFFLGQLNSDQHPYFEQIKALQVSAHVFIRRSGELIQFVPLHKRAWHAGVSNFRGRENCNDFSIGIELEGLDTESFTPTQYDALISCTKFIQIHYPLVTKDRIVGHSDIAPGRKTDPGVCFDWQRYFQGIGNF